MKNTPHIRNDNLKAQACKLYVNRVSTYIPAAVLKKDVKKINTSYFKYCV